MQFHAGHSAPTMTTYSLSLSLSLTHTHTQSAHKRVYLIDSSFRWGHIHHVDTKKHTNTHTLANVAAGPKIIILPNFSRHTTASHALAPLSLPCCYIFSSAPNTVIMMFEVIIIIDMGRP